MHRSSRSLRTLFAICYYRFKVKKNAVKNKWKMAGKKAGAAAVATSMFGGKSLNKSGKIRSIASPGRSKLPRAAGNSAAMSENVMLAALQKMEGRLAKQTASAHALVEARLEALEAQLKAAAG